MTAQPFSGTPITVITTQPTNPGTQPLILLRIGDKSWALDAMEAIQMSRELRVEAAKSPGDEKTIRYTINETTWELSGNAALRMASAIENEISKI